MSSRAVSAYRNLLRAGMGFADYNMREYVVRRTRDGFRKNRGATGPALAAAFNMVRVIFALRFAASFASLDSALAHPVLPPHQASEQLALVTRQAAISNAFSAGPSVMMAITSKRSAAAAPGGDGAAAAASATADGKGAGDPEDM
jgi:hypothetical protein